MSPARVFHRENRLRQLVETPGGKRIPDAARDAALAIEAVAADSAAAIDEALAALTRAVAEAPSDPAAQKAVYAQASVIAGLGATCGLDGLGKAAFSLCELADRQMLRSEWSCEAVRVHLDAMLLLRRPDMARSEVARASVLPGLAKVLAKTPKPA